MRTLWTVRTSGSGGRAGGRRGAVAGRGARPGLGTGRL